ncbi:hypothetical protein DFP73DRAFT_555843 [Morchella snyderi]|nr:hypothetical protein DFP73DRAFT_555843 [Morchella snyderi]
MAMEPPPDLIPTLHKALEELYENPPPPIPSPAATPKRASVALVIRIQPHPSYRPKDNNSVVSTLAEFFDLPWVQHGDPECLFIKRAARKGDRWTSHVALPGGKRDVEDKGDYEAAVRECLEEVGLDLDGEMAIDCGKLPDRVVTTSWGTVPLMVLCPFVFVHMSPTPPPLHLQPTEVASAHWVPLRTLLSPDFRTVHRCDVSDRLARQTTGLLGRFVRWGLRINLGQMEFSAVRLWPSHSVYSSFSGDFIADSGAAGGSWDRPMLLWGLTLGVATDFLEMLPHGEPATGWQYPTFTSSDVKAVVWLMTKSLRQRNWLKMQQGSKARALEDKRRLEDIDADGDTKSSMVLVQGRNENRQIEPRTSVVGTLLEGYYDIVRDAVWITLFGRTVIIGTALGAAWWKHRR